MKIYSKILLFMILSFSATTGATYIVAESGADFTSIQVAVNIAIAGDSILVREKSNPYFEKISFPNSGNASDGHIVLMAYPNEKPIIDGANYTAGDDWPHGLLSIINKNYIKVIGFEIRNLITSNGNLFPAGIWVRGNSSNIEIINNNIHHIEQNANNSGGHGIAVYGTHSSIPISNLLIDGNEVHNCKLGWSESLVLNGNVESFVVSNNIIHDNNNIAFDFIGHEGECSNAALDQARNGLVVGNIAYNIDSRGNSAYGDEASADGFYVDGGKDIIFERNIAYNCNIGFEVASEHGGKSTSGIIVRNNLIRENTVIGIAIGGYDSQRGFTDNCKVINNTLYKNNSEKFKWGAEILVQYYCEDNLFTNNIVYSSSDIPIVEHSTNTGSNNLFNHNLYFTDGNALWNWGASSYSNFENYKTSIGQEDNSMFSDPLLVNPSDNNPSIQENSQAIDKGKTIDEAIVGDNDFFGNSRVYNNQIDIGAVEFNKPTSVMSFGNIINNSFKLMPAYPNPFNPATAIRIKVSTSHHERIMLYIYDLLGKMVISEEFNNLNKNEIVYNWNAQNNTSGIYYVVVKSKNEFQTEKLALIK